MLLMLLEDRMCLYHSNNNRSRSGKCIVTNPTKFYMYVKTECIEDPQSQQLVISSFTSNINVKDPNLIFYTCKSIQAFTT